MPLYLCRFNSPNRQRLATLQFQKSIGHDADDDLYCVVRELQVHQARTIYRGVVVHGSRFGTPIIVKAAIGTSNVARLQHEVAMYQTLQHLQGGAIPQLLGYYKAVHAIDGSPSHCLVLHDAGDTLDDALRVRGLLRDARHGHEAIFKDVPFTWRRSILSAFVALHNAGFERTKHAVFRTIAIRNGHATLLSIGGVLSHQCTRTLDLIPETVRPDADDFDCTELFFLGNDLNFWALPFLSYYGCRYSVDEFLFQFFDLADQAPANVSEKVAIEEAIDCHIRYMHRSRPSYAKQFDIYMAAARDSIISTYIALPVSLHSSSPVLEMMEWLPYTPAHPTTTTISPSTSGSSATSGETGATSVHSQDDAAGVSDAAHEACPDC